MKGQLNFVSETSKEQINHLRMQEYANASGFSVDPNTLKWKHSDDHSLVMAAEVDGHIISTMRGEVIEDLSLLEAKLECPWSFSANLKMPVLLLSRAATLSSHRAQGLNLVMRYWFLKFTQFHRIPFVVGTFVSGSPREKTLQQMGYQLFENTLGWQQSTYRSLRPVTVAALDFENQGEQALLYCQAQVPQMIVDYPLTTPFPNLKIVRTL